MLNSFSSCSARLRTLLIDLSACLACSPIPFFANWPRFSWMCSTRHGRDESDVLQIVKEVLWVDWTVVRLCQPMRCFIPHNFA
jgi:hypothetical protein